MLGVRPFDRAARVAFRSWLLTDALPREPKEDDALDEWIGECLARAKVERPRSGRFDRVVHAIRRQHEKRVFDQVLAQLDDGMRK